MAHKAAKAAFAEIPFGIEKRYAQLFALRRSSKKGGKIMFCKNCGAEIPDGSAFCGNCGMKVSAEPVQQEPVNQYASPDLQAYRAEPTSVDAPCVCVESKPEPQPQYAQPEPQSQYTQPEPQPQYAQPEPQPQYTQPQYAQPEPPQYNSQPIYNAQPIQPEALPNPTLWIILNIVMIVLGCCCSFSGIAGIIGLVFAIQGNNAVKAGDLATAQSKLKTAKILFFVSLGLFVVGNILGIVTGLFSDYLAQLEDYMYYM